MTSHERFFLHMLVPVDGSESSRKAADFAVRLAFCEKCEVAAVHVVDEQIAEEMARFSEAPLEVVVEKMKKSGAAYLEDVRKRGEEEGVQVTGEVRVGVPHQVVLALAAEKGADLIVMGKVGRKGPRRVLIGSVTERVIEHSPVPVLVVK